MAFPNYLKFLESTAISSLSTSLSSARHAWQRRPTRPVDSNRQPGQRRRHKLERTPATAARHALSRCHQTGLRERIVRHLLQANEAICRMPARGLANIKWHSSILFASDHPRSPTTTTNPGDRAAQPRAAPASPQLQQARPRLDEDLDQAAGA
jgi:hypothetical protein